MLLFILLLRWSFISIADDIVDEHEHRHGNGILNHRNGHRWVNEKANYDDHEIFPKKAKIKCRNSTKFRIPNIINHVWFGNRELLFHQYLSIR